MSHHAREPSTLPKVRITNQTVRGYERISRSGVREKSAREYAQNATAAMSRTRGAQRAESPITGSSQPFPRRATAVLAAYRRTVRRCACRRRSVMVGG